MVSQFLSTHAVPLLGDIKFQFPEGTHAIGRLDKESEGLLLLTTNKKITRLLFQGKQPHRRKYLIQVSGIMQDETLQVLRQGVTILVKQGLEYTTMPTEINVVKEPEKLFSSGYVLHERVPNTWLEMVLTEGKFHQVRKMVKAVRHPCKRLIRVSIEDLTLGNLKPGEVGEVTEEVFFGKLKL